MVIACGVLELLVRHIPTSVCISGTQLAEDNTTIETLILGASQNKRAINPEHLSTKTITAAGARQGHKTDYYLLKDLHKQLPNLQRVVIGATYRHFESRPNPKNFWKYRSHLLYYDVNAFERPVYFKDKLLYLGNPSFYSNQLENYYLKDKKSSFNRFGYQVTGQVDRFARHEYNEETIIETYTPHNYKVLSTHYLDISTRWFTRVLDYCKTHNIQVIITKTPTILHYRQHQDSGVLQRRDSVVAVALKKYPTARLFDQEQDPDYTIQHYLNENHLNPEGARMFTKKLDLFIKESTSYQN